MTLDFLYKYLLFISNKAVTGNSISPEEFNIALQVANIKHMKVKCGLPESYRPGQPIAPQSPETTIVITDDIMPFKVHMGSPNVPYMQVDAQGYAPIPPDFFYPMAISYKYFKNVDCTGSFRLKKVDNLTDQQFDYVAGSFIRKPTLAYPCCNFQAGVIRFLPENIQRVEFVYLRLPATPVYDYYISAEGEHIYMAPGTTHALLAGEEYPTTGATTGTVTSLSVELEWNDTNKLDILSLVMSMLGINMREGALQQFAEMSKQTGV
jgi:hypothetical protein